MNIIKNGRPQLPQLFRGTCEKCGCRVEEERHRLYSNGPTIHEAFGKKQTKKQIKENFFVSCPTPHCFGKIFMDLFNK